MEASLPRAPTPPHAYWESTNDVEDIDETTPSKWWGAFARRRIRRRRRISYDSFSSGESSGRWRRLSSLTSRSMVGFSGLTGNGEDSGGSLRTFGGLIQFRDRRASVVTVARSPSFNSVSPWDSALFAYNKNNSNNKDGSSDDSRRSFQAHVVAAVYMTAR